jgi:mono/diheme cytochrome c family protein
MVTGQIEFISAEAIDHNARHPDPPPPALNADYGKHLLETGCVGCHGPNFSGGKIPGTPPDWPEARNLTPDPVTGIGKWTEADFFRALRTGKRPDGDSIRAPMPWQATAQMTDEEIRSIWLHLRRLPARKMGGR